MQNAWRFIDDEILREPATRKPIRQRTWHRGRLPTRRRRRSRCPSSRWATANLPVAKRILAATDKSIAWLADPSHRDEAIELLVKVARSSIEDAEPQRDCGPARNQSAWRHEAQAARRPGSQCRRHLLRTRVGASRAIRAQSGSASSTSAREIWSSRGGQRPDAQVLWRTPRPSRSPPLRRVPATGRVSKEPRGTVGAIAVLKRSDCQSELSTRPIVDTSHSLANPSRP